MQLNNCSSLPEPCASPSCAARAVIEGPATPAAATTPIAVPVLFRKLRRVSPDREPFAPDMSPPPFFEKRMLSRNSDEGDASAFRHPSASTLQRCGNSVPLLATIAGQAVRNPPAKRHGIVAHIAPCALTPLPPCLRTPDESARRIPDIPHQCQNRPDSVCHSLPYMFVKGNGLCMTNYDSTILFCR